MICASCGRDNPEGVTYCLDCGRKLEQEVAAAEASPPPGDGAKCPRCGAENPPSMNFCKRCGTPLTTQKGEEPSSPAEPEPAAPPGSEPAAPPPSEPAAPPAGDASAPRICERCHGTLDVDAQFCKFCGLSLGPSEAPAAAPMEPMQPDETGGRTGPLGGAASVKAGKARLVAILKDGSEGQSYPLASEEPTEIGRKEGNILLSEDPYLSPRHARLTSQNGRYFLKDLASTNGVFTRIREKCRLHHGDVLLVGQQVLKFEVLEEAERGLGPASQHGTLVFGTPEGSCIARLCQTTTEGIIRDVYHLRRQEVVIGREGPDIVFPDDPFMSRKHARISYDGDSRTFVLEDLGSFNGTSLRFRGERELQSGDQFRVGNHLFLFETGGVER